MKSGGALGALDGEGHLDEATVEALADGQPVSEEGLDHAEACDACAARVAEAAERAMELAPAFAALAARVAETELAPNEVFTTGTRVREGAAALEVPAPVEATAARASSTLPRWWVPAALGLVVLTSVPELWRATEGLGRSVASARVVARALAQGVAVLIGEAGKPTVAFAVAFTMAVTGLSIAILAGRGKQAGTNGRGKHGMA